VRGIADTGFLVAFVNRNDRHHEWAVRVAETVTEPLLTCEAVLAETAFHLESVPVVLALLREGLVTLAFDCRDHLAQLALLADRYASRKPDLADWCLIRMSELFPRHSVITVDRTDFRGYRRNKRETIPLGVPARRLTPRRRRDGLRSRPRHFRWHTDWK
jgi:predicted nucleic acid-binding protein